jgi:hypothetical protein
MGSWGDCHTIPARRYGRVSTDIQLEPTIPRNLGGDGFSGSTSVQVRAEHHKPTRQRLTLKRDKTSNRCITHRSRSMASREEGNRDRHHANCNARNNLSEHRRHGTPPIPDSKFSVLYRLFATLCFNALQFVFCVVSEEISSLRLIAFLSQLKQNTNH